MFDLLPYGATIDLKCTSCSKEGLLIDTWETSTRYTLRKQQLGKNNCYFLESMAEPVTMTYEYTKKNGILVGISTNLEIIDFDFGEDGNGSFTISNEEWFNIPKNSRPTPYIKLLFNKVKVECCFTNPWTSAFYHPTYSENGWGGLDIDSDSPDILKPFSQKAENYCLLARYVTVSWSTEEENELFLGEGEDGLNDHWYQGWFSCGKEDGTIVNFDYNIDHLSQRLWSTVNNDPFNLVVPPLNGTSTLNGIRLYNYFKIGYTINFKGEDQWKDASTLSIDGEYHVYDKNGFITKANLKNKKIKSENGSPILEDHPVKTIWGSTSKFYITAEGHYVSPADGVEIISKWTTGCFSYCPTDCPNDSGGDCPCNVDCEDSICTCNTQCTCDTVCGCNTQCTCNTQCECNTECPDGYTPWKGKIKYNNTHVTNEIGDLVRYAQAGEEVIVYGELIRPGTSVTYYNIGNGQYVHHDSVEPI